MYINFLIIFTLLTALLILICKKNYLSTLNLKSIKDIHLNLKVILLVGCFLFHFYFIIIFI